MRPSEYKGRPIVLPNILTIFARETTYFREKKKKKRTSNVQMRFYLNLGWPNYI